MKSLIIAFAFIALTAADVSHLNLNREYLPPDQQHHHHGGSAASSASVSSSQYGGAVGIQGRIGSDVEQHYQQQSQDIPDSYAPLSNDISVDVPAVQEQDIPAGGIGRDTYTPAHLAEQQQSIPGGNSDSYTPAHLIEHEHHIPGGNSDSYTPAHHIEQAQHVPGDNSDSYTPAHLIEQEQHIPGGHSDSYTPAHLIEQEQHIPGGHSDTYTPAHLIEQEQHIPAAIGANTYTPAHLNQPAAQEQYAPAQTQEQQPEVQAYQNTQLRFGGEVQQSGSVGNAASGIDTQYGTNGGYVY